MTTTVEYLAADDWGMWWDTTNPRPERQPDPECYIHHVGGAAWMDGDAAAVFRELNHYAINTKGHDALDYDILVHYDRTRDILTIGEGRGEFMSAATRNRNEQGEAVVLCGNTHLREPHPAELEGLARAHVIGVEQGWIARDAQILGHRDNLAYPDGQATACPGQYLYPRLDYVRARAARLLNPFEEDDMSKRLLARNKNNPYELRVGDGIRAEVYRTREWVHIVEHYGEPDVPPFYHPQTGELLATREDVPLMSEKHLDMWVGYETGAALADEG